MHGGATAGVLNLFLSLFVIILVCQVSRLPSHETSNSEVVFMQHSL